MITISNDNVLDGPAPVVPVNLVGVMGRGLAFDAKRRWPRLYDYYRQSLADGNLAGTTAGTGVRLTHWHGPSGRPVILFPTKVNWRNRSPRALVAAALHELAATARRAKTLTISLPPVGCGLGGLNRVDIARLALEAAQEDPDLVWAFHRWGPRAENILTEF